MGKAQSTAADRGLLGDSDGAPTEHASTPHPTRAGRVDEQPHVDDRPADADAAEGFDLDHHHVRVIGSPTSRLCGALGRTRICRRPCGRGKPLKFM